MDDRSKSAPPWRLKLFCWVLLAMFSAVLAEVPAGSSPMLLYHPWGLLVVTPLYGLHLLFFATIVYRWGRPTFFTLFFAGALFGLYEAYITKVLWNPTWTGDYHHLAGLVVEPTLMMTLFWHNWMAFILAAGGRRVVADALAHGAGRAARAAASVVGAAGSPRLAAGWRGVDFWAVRQRAAHPTEEPQVAFAVVCGPGACS
ncbi:MAG: hypothetical protein M1457_07980 [bacterium]|nr:hypothetical protein [bacterium]